MIMFRVTPLTGHQPLKVTHISLGYSLQNPEVLIVPGTQ